MQYIPSKPPDARVVRACRSIQPSSDRAAPAMSRSVPVASIARSTTGHRSGLTIASTTCISEFDLKQTY